MSLLLDTHVLIWALENEAELGVRARQEIEQATRTSGLMVSAVSFWEVALLAAKKRIALHRPAHQWRNTALRQGTEVISLDGECAMEAVCRAHLHATPMNGSTV